jgi:hypothetical protein
MQRIQTAGKLIGAASVVAFLGVLGVEGVSAGGGKRVVAAAVTPAATDGGAAGAGGPTTELTVWAQCMDAAHDRTKLSKANETLKQLEAVKPSVTYNACADALKDMCGKAARHEFGAPVLDSADKVRVCAKLQSGLTAGSASVASEVVQSIAQVVVNKAQAAGWELLIDKIKEAAHCPKEDGSPADTKFGATCKVLGTLNLKDLVSSPGVLLQAMVSDLMAQINPVVGTAIEGGVGIAALAFNEATARWAQSGAPGVVQAMRATIANQIDQYAAAQCPATPNVVVKYGYVMGMCLAQTTFAQLSKCDAATLIGECADAGDAPDAGTDSGAEAGDGPGAGTGSSAAKDELVRLWDLTTTAFSTSPKPIDMLNLGFALAHDEVKAMSDAAKQKVAEDYLDGIDDLLTGLAAQDWVKATSGGVQLLTTIEKTLPDRDGCKDDAAAKQANPAAADACTNLKKLDPATCNGTDADCRKVRDRIAYADAIKLLKIMAAVGNYALTFSQDKTDPAAASAARDMIITELVDRMVNRSERTSGAVVSVGGSLGAFGGPRFAWDNGLHTQAAFPLQLTLGLGLQTYAAGTGGLHAMLSFIDLGQYLNWNDSGSLTVNTPDVQSSLGFGLTLGGWFALRQTPFFLAAHGSVAPFNQANGKPTYQAGLVTGIYVPLLDFN